MKKLHFTGERMIPEINIGQQIYVEHMARYFFASQFVKRKKVLDIACGSGYGSYYLLQQGAREVVGVDISMEAVNYAKEKYLHRKITFIKGDAEKLPFDEQFDVIITLETIEHLHEQLAFLQEMKRVLKKDGVLILSTPNALVHPKGNIFHTTEFNQKKLADLLSRYFENIEILYQDNMISSAIMTSKSLGQNENSDNQKVSVRNLKLSAYNSKRSLFLIAVASNKKLPKITEICAFGFPKKLKKMERDIVKLNQQLKGKINELKNIYSRLDSIYKSRSWKIISRLHDIQKNFFKKS